MNCDCYVTNHPKKRSGLQHSSVLFSGLYGSLAVPLLGVHVAAFDGQGPLGGEGQDGRSSLSGRGCWLSAAKLLVAPHPPIASLSSSLSGLRTGC